MFMRRAKIRPNLSRVTKPVQSPSVNSSQPDIKPDEDIKDVKILTNISCVKPVKQEKEKNEIKVEQGVEDGDITITGIITAILPDVKKDVPDDIVPVAEETGAVAPRTSCTLPNQDFRAPEIGVIAPDSDTKPDIAVIPVRYSPFEKVNSQPPSLDKGVSTVLTPIEVDCTTSETVSEDVTVEPIKEEHSKPPSPSTEPTPSAECETPCSEVPEPDVEPIVPSSCSRRNSSASVTEVRVTTSDCVDSAATDTGPSPESEPQHDSSAKPAKKVKSEKEAARSRRVLHKNKEPPERSKMTMVDLIYYNPTENPMTTVSSKRQAKEATKDPKNDVQPNKSPNLEPPEPSSQTLAPRVKIGEDGQIILDEESLVIEHTVPEGFNVVVEDSETTYFSFRDRNLTRRWSSEETGLFYKGLTLFGTDFSLMAQIMRMRTRHELKLKFKREERQNRKLIDVILRCVSAYGIEEFQNDVDEYIKKVEEEKERKKKRLKGKRSNKSAEYGKKGDVEDSDLESVATSEYASYESPSVSLSEIGDRSTTESLQEPENSATPDNNELHSTSASPDYTSKKPVGKKQTRRPRTTKSKPAPVCNDKKVKNKRRGRKRKHSDTGPPGSEEPNASENVTEVPPSDLICQTVEPMAPQEIVLVSETGEMLPLEVVYEKPTVGCHVQEMEVISNVEESNDSVQEDTDTAANHSTQLQELENTLTEMFGDNL